MKKLLKPEMEFIKFNTEDVITTSGDKIPLATKTPEAAAEGPHASQEYSSGVNNLWNNFNK